MNIVFLRANAINPDPRVEKEVKALLRRGHNCQLIGWDRDSDHPGVDTTIELNGALVPKTLFGVRSVFGSGLKNAPRLIKFNRLIYRWLIRNSASYDCVHACDLDTGFVAYLAAKKTGKPYVYDIFDFYAESRIMPSKLVGLVRRTEFKVVEGAYATLICTDQRRVQLTGSNPKEVLVIENTPESDFNAEGPSRDGGGNLGLRLKTAYVGLLTSDRYIERVLSAVKEHDDLQLTIGGFGPLEDKVRSYSDSCSRIVFAGKTPYRETLEIESEADVMFGLYDPRIPNNKLAAPNKYYESLMLGTPIITVEGTSVGDWVAAEGVGAVLPADFDEAELHAAVVDLAAKNADGKISRRQRVLYETEHSWDIMASRLQELYGRMETEIGVQRS